MTRVVLLIDTLTRGGFTLGTDDKVAPKLPPERQVLYSEQSECVGEWSNISQDLERENFFVSLSSYAIHLRHSPARRLTTVHNVYDALNIIIDHLDVEFGVVNESDSGVIPFEMYRNYSPTLVAEAIAAYPGPRFGSFYAAKDAVQFLEKTNAFGGGSSDSS